jgi:mRNA interferase MazF
VTKGKVVPVPFPLDDLTAAKVRPAVCLTEFIGPHRHVVAAFVSSRVVPDLLATDLLLDPSHPDFTASGLRVPSTLRLHRLMTVNTSVFQRQLGKLTNRLLTDVDDRLRTLFGLGTK